LAKSHRCGIACGSIPVGIDGIVVRAMGQQ